MRVRVLSMTRIAPTLTLLAVAALGGGMFVANAINDPGTTPRRDRYSFPTSLRRASDADV